MVPRFGAQFKVPAAPEGDTGLGIEPRMDANTREFLCDEWQTRTGLKIRVYSRPFAVQICFLRCGYATPIANG